MPMMVTDNNDGKIMVEQLSGKSPMGSDDHPVCCVSIEKGHPYADLERKKPAVSILSTSVYLFLFVLVSCLLFKVVFHPCKTREADLQESIDDLQNKIAIMEKMIMSNLKQESPLTQEEDSTSTNGTAVLRRLKRSPRRGGRGSRGPAVSCHLEGKGGPNIFSPLEPLQRPRHASESILWKVPDRQPPIECTMKTEQDSGGHGIQYIKIDRRGSYYVYSQLTYKTEMWDYSGHRVELFRDPTRMQLLQVQTSPKELTRDERGTETDESRYTGGVFYLQPGDLLAVYPVQGFKKFVMRGDLSFFGIFLLKGS